MNTTVWLINFVRGGEQQKLVHTHNAIADYRSIDPAASVTEIDCAAVAKLIEADAEYDQALHALSELNRKIAEDGWLEVQHDALREAGRRLVRARNGRADALANLGGAL